MGKVLSGGQLACGNTSSTRAGHDFYATDPKTTRAFLQAAGHIFQDVSSVHEPCCGQGHMSRVLREFFDCPVVDTDLVDRGYGQGGVDFLKEDFEGKSDLIMTNPPFSLANDFILKGLKDTNRYLVLLCRIQLLESLERKKILEGSPLAYVYVHSKRQAPWKRGQPRAPNGKKWATTMCLAWFVWDKQYQGEPRIRFL